MSVGEYSCNSQSSEGSDYTLLVAFLHSSFVPQTYKVSSKCREKQPSFKSDNDVS